MTDDRRLARNPIAIVGMSGLLPRARNHREYWQNIVDGVDCTEEVPASRWSLDDYYDPDPAAADKTYSRRGAFLPDIDFDPLEFGLPPNQLEVTSTMQTLSLGVARDLLIDAGAVDSPWYDPSRTGVVLGTTGPVPLMHPLAARLSTPVLKEAARSVGLSEGDADAIADKFVAAFAPWEENSFPGLLANVVAGRVANRLGLGGINCTVDAACAASLAAIRTAIAELQDGRADMVLTGGVDTENTIFIYLCFSKVGALSPTGRISPFSDAANGTLLGEGITMLALRRLSDARRDGNRIYAVIRGLGSSSDGRAKSIYAPRAEGQRLALQRAYADAECSPADIELIEAHATGTAVGDKTELTALKGVLSEASAETGFAALGSVKSQIGHTKGAAGTASVMKLALALHQKVLPGTINVDAPNPEISAPDAPYYVNTRTRPWILDPQRPVRRAAASAMGFGGTNFHLVLEEADQQRGRGSVLHRTPRAHLWHAPDVAGLIDAVRSVEPGDGGDIPEDHARIGFVSVDDDSADHLRELAVDELIRDPEAAQWDHPEGVYFRSAALPQRRVGALFAGQGSQYVDMGAAAALDNPPVGAAFDTANAAFAGAARRLSSVVFPPPAFDEQTRSEQELTLRRTEFAQPAIGAMSAGQFRVLTEFGFRADGYLGHSFGELTALWASGALETEDFHRLARARGVAMTPEEGVDAGTMMAVGATRETTEEIIADIDDVWICNHNAPDQVVVGGGAAGIAAVGKRCAEREIVTRELPVSGAFHTPYVGHAVTAFAEAVGAVRIAAPDATVYADTPGVRYGEDEARNRAILTEQLSKPVEFAAALTAMYEDGCTIFVEFGPKQVLTSLVRRTLGDKAVAIATDSGPVGDGSLALARAAVRLAVLGVELREINRYGAPRPAAATSKPGMTVPLSAPEYVPQSRREAYAAALGDGYRVSVAAPEPVLTHAAAAPATAHLREVERPVVPAQSNGASHTSVRPSPQPRESVARDAHDAYAISAAPASDALTLDTALAQHLRTHNQYLDGQLDIARGLAGALSNGTLDEFTVRAIEAVKDHGVTISASHTHAVDVLVQLAELESGFAAPVRAPSQRVVPSALPEPAPERRIVTAQEQSFAPVAYDAGDTGDAGTAVPTAVASVESNGSATESAPRVSAPTPAASEGPSAEELRRALQEVVAEKTGYPVEMVDPGRDLEADLGVDSIKRVQVIGALQQRFPQLPSLGPEQLGTLRTLDQIVAEFAASTGGDVHPKAEAAASTPRHIVEPVALPPVDVAVDPYPAEAKVLVVDLADAESDRAGIEAAAAARGWRVRTVGSVAEAGTDDVDICVVMVGGDADQEKARRRLTDVILTAKQVLPRLLAATGRSAFVTVTRLDGALGFLGTAEPAAALLGGAGGVVKTLAAEHSSIFCRALDIEPAVTGGQFAEAILRELSDSARDTMEVGIDAIGQRRTPVPSGYAGARSVTTVCAGSEQPPSVLSEEDVLVVTGGARGVTATCVRALAERSAARFVLLGRSELSPEPPWAVGVADAELKQAALRALAGTGSTPRDIERHCSGIRATREIRSTLRDLDGRAEYIAVDVTDEAAVRDALAPVSASITGVVHGAGVLADSMIASKTEESIDRVLLPKIGGLAAVLAALGELRHLILFTSVAGLFGNAGQADYACANEALTRFAVSYRRANPGCHVTAIDWGAWDGGMVTPELREFFVDRGIALLAPEWGAAAFTEQFTEERAADTVVLIGPATPLSRADSADRGRVRARRTLTGLTEEPVIAAHRIGEHIVLPATFGLGAMINLAERRLPGRSVIGVRDFQVLKGIVFDHPVDELDIELEPDGAEGIVLRASVIGSAATHFRAVLTLADHPDTPPRHSVPDGVRAPADDIYRDAVQFHAPALQGMRSILAASDEAIVLECSLPATTVAAGAYAGRLHDPVLADLILQGPPVLGHRLLGSACLPLGVGRVDYYRPLPAGERFVLVVDNPRAGQVDAHIDATAISTDGAVLQRFSDVTVVTTPDLTEKFRTSVRQWMS
ncbi:SDR family NAD(P)-dependent oxidoreductase [Nocardia sp. NPDC005366]|uniref:SDR family NAD(P)-dependent oxidoreductase n=1 Tax=Nocardia sp. NPDC005366 TaxID=3156878 RepID=UPI0033ABE01C